MPSPKFQNDPNELTRFKEEIDLVQFAIDQGYQLKKPTANTNAEQTTVTLARDFGDGSDETILIRKNGRTGHFLYYNPSNSDDKGSVIDFTINKLNVNIGKARQILRQYLGKSPIINITPSPPIKPKEIDQDHFKVKPLSDTTYLERRSIALNIIKHPMFAPTIGLKTATHKASGKEFTNTAFLIKDLQQRTIGLELKNYDPSSGSHFKGTFEGSQKAMGMWTSVPPKTEKTTTFGILESPIDAMSHYQLTQDPLDFKKKPLFYLSTNGQLSPHHIPYIQHHIDHMKPNKVKLLNDNDLAGIRFNATLLGSLRPPAKEVSGKLTVVNNDQINMKVDFIKPKNRLSIEIGHPEKTDKKTLVDNLTNYFKNLNKKLFDKFSFKKNEFELEKIEQNEVKTVAHYYFDNRKEMLLESVQAVKELKPSKFMEIEVPKHKDWNQDLVESLKKDKEVGKEGVDQDFTM